MTQPKYDKKHKCQNVKINATNTNKRRSFGVTVRSDRVLKTIDEKEQLSKRRTDGTHRDILKVPKYAF